MIVVNAGDDLQAALDRSQSGDELVLEAGARFKGNYVLRAKGGTNWITIRSSRLAELPEGFRVAPAQASAMATISSSNSSAALRTEPGAQFYRLSGIEITLEPGVDLNYGLVLLGIGTETASQMPSDLVLDRTYIHGTSTCNCKRGVAINGAREAVIDSYVSNIHSRDQDAQAIAGWNGPGPFKIVNNYLEASGENFMLGGADPVVQDLTPSDIEFRRNHAFKPLSWKTTDPSYAGTRWYVKNLLELKNSQRVLIDGNMFENSWTDAQTGEAIILKSSNQNGGCPWCATQDVTFSNNIIKNAEGGVVLNGPESPLQTRPTARIAITNILFSPELQRLLLIANSVKDVRVSHITGFNGYYILATTQRSDVNNGPFLVQDSILERRKYGVSAGGYEGTYYLNTYFSPWTWDHNLLLNTSVPGPYTTNTYLMPLYPGATLFAAGTNSVSFLNYAGGASDYHGYALASDSIGHGAASDGRDIGVDFAALDAAMTSPTEAPNSGGGQPPPTPADSFVLSVTPDNVSVAAGARQQFNADLKDSAGSRVGTAQVSWSIAPEVGVITSAGLYTAPSTSSTAQMVLVTATDTLDSGRTATATILLLPAITVTAIPSSVSLGPLSTQQFSASVQNSTNGAVVWSISPAVGQISVSGRYLAPAEIITRQTVTVKATSQADSGKFATAAVTLVPPPVTITVTPSSGTVRTGGQIAFAATVNNASNRAVTWTLSPAVGTLTAAGLYTAPTSLTEVTVISVVARSEADRTKTASAAVTIVPNVSVSVGPAGMTLRRSQTQQFSAIVSNTKSTAVTWSVTQGLGTVSVTGLYRAPAVVAVAQTAVITACSQTDISKAASVSVILVPTVEMTVAPSRVTLRANQRHAFTATVKYTDNTAVTWSISPKVGTISTTGEYRAPASVAVPTTVVITAASRADQSPTASATVLLLPPVRVVVTPTDATVGAGGTLQLTATVLNGQDNRVRWSISPKCGTIDSNGMYMAPSRRSSNTYVTAKATSLEDPKRAGVASILVRLR